MNDHKCIYENWWGEIKSDIRHIKETLDKLNGKDGVLVQAQLNKASLTRVWWFIGAIAAMFLATGVKAWFF